MVDTANVTFWLRTLLQQNSDLVEVVAKLEAGTRYFTRHFKWRKCFETVTLFFKGEGLISSSCSNVVTFKNSATEHLG